MDSIGFSRMAGPYEQPPIRKTDAWPHQCMGWKFADRLGAAMLAFGMGCGKTRTAIDLLTNWQDTGNTLVVCPKAVVPTWPWEFEKHCASDRYVVVPLTKGTTKQKTELLDNALKRNYGKSTVVVVNYETLYREPLNRFLLRKWSTVILDESHRIKAPQGRTSKYLAKLQRFTDRKILLTGTPMPHSPLDLFAQWRFLDPTVFGNSFTRFRGRYAQVHPQFPSKVLRWLEMEELKQKFFERAVRVRSEDVLDLPPKIEQRIGVTIGTKARRIYDDLEKNMIAQLEAGEITASNALVKLLRMQQLTGGYITPDEGETPVEVDIEKYRTLCDLVDDFPEDEPVVVFCRFRGDIESVRRAASGLGRPFGQLDGRRNDLAGNQLPATIDGKPGYIMAVQIQSGGTGIDLTRSAFAVYYSIGYSMGDYEQSQARLHRPGQTRPVRYYHLVASDTVDERVYQVLKERGEVVAAVLDSYGLKKGIAA